MLSMTGFGRAAVNADGRRLVVEIRSVNHRGLEVKVRGRHLAAACEIEIVRAVRATLARGAVQVAVDEESDARPAALPVDRAKAIYRALEDLRHELDLVTPVDLATVAAFLRLDREGDVPVSQLTWPQVQPALGEALAALVAMRAREGAALAVELEGRRLRIDQLVADLKEATRPLTAKAARRLEERLASAGTALDPARLAQEVALLADRLDVTEELERLDVHRAHLATLLGGAPSGPEAPRTDGVGRSLEFLLQEIGRELNTIGSKALDADVSALVIAGKAEMEKIREQAQNIE